MELNAPGATPSNHISELEGNNESGKAEVNGEREDESEAEGERQTQGSSDKSSGGWKVSNDKCFGFERPAFERLQLVTYRLWR